MLWFRKRPAMGTNLTLGAFLGSWAVFPSRGDRLTGVASVAGGIGRLGIAGVIGGTVPGILLRVMRRWTRFVDFSARFVVGFGNGRAKIGLVGVFGVLSHYARFRYFARVEQVQTLQHHHLSSGR